MLTIICGNMGAGKTLFATILAFYSKKNVVSNYHINIIECKNTEKRSFEEFSVQKFVNAEYSNCMLILDEAYAYLESRISGSDINRIMSYILFQSRKKDLDLYITAQLISTLDLRFRNLADFYIQAINNEFTFDYFILNRATYSTKTIQLSKQSVLPFFQFYNTNEVIQPNKSNIEHSYLTGREKMEKAREIASDILDSYEISVTQDIMKSYCLENEIPTFLQKMIWTQIKLLKNENKKDSKEE